MLNVKQHLQSGLFVSDESRHYDYIGVCPVPAGIEGSNATTRSRKFSNPRDCLLKYSYCFDIWRAARQHCCRAACQISERLDDSKHRSRAFEALRDLTIRHLIWYRNGPQVSIAHNSTHNQPPTAWVTFYMTNSLKYACIHASCFANLGGDTILFFGLWDGLKNACDGQGTLQHEAGLLNFREKNRVWYNILQNTLLGFIKYFTGINKVHPQTSPPRWKYMWPSL